MYIEPVLPIKATMCNTCIFSIYHTNPAHACTCVCVHVLIPCYSYVTDVLHALALVHVGGLIPLHNACSFGHSDVVTLLLKNGADPNSRDNWNFTPLHEAAIKGKVDVCISESLV